MTQGGLSTVLVMSTTEYTTTKSRGVLISLNIATFYWGMWAANALGAYFHYKNIGILGIVCSIYNFISLLFIPESPFWLACQGKYEECATAHRWLKGNDTNTANELNAMIKYQEEFATKSKIKRSPINTIIFYLKVLREPEIIKPASLCFLVTCLYHFSGKFTCAVYAVEIMIKFTKSLDKAFAGVLILDGFSVFSIYVGTVLVKYFKRRTLLLGTCMGCIISLLLLSLYIYLVKLNVVLENYYVFLSILIFYSFAICSGPMVVVSAVFAELFPLNHRSFTVCILSILGNICMATLLKLGPFIFEAFEIHGTFLFFGLIFALCSFLCYKYLPETKDKTLEQISEYFRTKNSTIVTESLLENR